MIEIITQVVFTDVLQKVRQKDVSIRPASGTLERTFDSDDHGRYLKYRFSATVPDTYRDHPILDCDLIVKVITEDGTAVSFGSDDFPVRLKKELSQICRISAEYTSAA